MLYCNSLVDCLPTLVIFLLLLWTYYMYVVELGIKVIRYENIVKFTFYLIIYHILFIMMMVTYFKVMCANIAVVPNKYRFPPDLYKKIQETETEEAKHELILQFCHTQHLTVVTRSDHGYIRACNICKLVKPDRAHHCRKCGTCILKMDHHCPWLNNCIGFLNYKFFLLFLFYTSLYCVFLTLTILEYVVIIWNNHIKDYHELHYVIGFGLALIFGTTITCFLCDHLNMACHNRTTLEKLKATTFRDFNDSLSFDLGICDNLTEVFGYNYFTWFLPIQTSVGDGIHYPVRFKV